MTLKREIRANRGAAAGVLLLTVVSLTAGCCPWGPREWHPADVGLIRSVSSGDQEVRALAIWNDGHGPALYAGGCFDKDTSLSGVQLNNIARWNGSTFSSLDAWPNNGVTGVFTNPNPEVFALAVYNNELIVAGNFKNVPGPSGLPIEVNNIAKWNGTSWSALGRGTNSTVNALAVYKNELIVGGHFNVVNGADSSALTSGGISVSLIAKWNGSNWSTISGLASNNPSLKEGVVDRVPATGGGVLSLAVFNRTLIVGGAFGSIQPPTGPAIQSINNIAQWNGNSWSALGGGLMGDLCDPDVNNDNVGNVNALVVWHNPVRRCDQLIAGGDFVTADWQPAHHVAAWDGATWSALDGGTGDCKGGPVYALTTYRGDLIAAGAFSHVGGGDPKLTNASNVAKWDGVNWSLLQDAAGKVGVGGTARCLATCKCDLIVGGQFDCLGFGSAPASLSWARWGP